MRSARTGPPDFLPGAPAQAWHSGLSPGGASDSDPLEEFIRMEAGHSQAGVLEA